ncbi:MAG: hypothetical protein WAL85_11550 [Candidatus Korobacteraceae bacterium]
MAKDVLVVDDERVIADTLAAILRNAGYEVAAAYDGLTQPPSFFAAQQLNFTA